MTTTTFRKRSIITIALLFTSMAACANKKVAMSTWPTPAPAISPREPASVPVAPTAHVPTPVPDAVQSHYPDATTRARIDELLARIQDAYFDYDRHNLRPDALQALQADAKELGELLHQFADFKLKVEGHCDERGSAEYNLALGDRRATAAKEYLVAMGIPSDQVTVTTYGKEQQVCNEHNEACWQKNRRAHVVALVQ